MRFEVSRKRWYRGKGSKSSRLLRHDGTMCCLGFRCLAAGCTEDEIVGATLPHKIPLKEYTNGSMRSFISEKKMEGLVEIGESNWRVPTAKCELIASHNDDEYEIDADREAKLRELFASIGDEVVFVE